MAEGNAFDCMATDPDTAIGSLTDIDHVGLGYTDD